MRWADEDRNMGEWAGARNGNQIDTSSYPYQQIKRTYSTAQTKIATTRSEPRSRQEMYRWNERKKSLQVPWATAGASHCICNGHRSTTIQRVSVNIQQIESKPKFKHITEQNSPSGPRLRCGTHSRARLPRGTGPCWAPGHNPPGGGGGGGEAAVGPSLDCWGVSEDLNLLASYSGMGCEKWHVPPCSAIDFARGK